MLSSEQIKKQSLTAYNQWKDLWRQHCKEHSKFEMKPLSDFMNIGVGKACLAVANGYSFETNIETIKKWAHNVDIICCDKTLGSLLDHGIKPTYCLVADAKVNYESYLKPWEDKLQDTILFMNVCGNTLWSTHGNWKDRYFFANMDVINSQQEFQGLSKCPNAIPAGTNVSNAMIIMLTQSDNGGRRNFFGYDKILLIGYDYCWRRDGGYYAFDKTGNGKANYMRHIYARNIKNRLVFTSNNLGFSAQWLDQYINAFKLPVVQCSDETVLPTSNLGKLEEQMQYRYKPEHSEWVRKQLARRDELLKEKRLIESQIAEMGREHYYRFKASL